MKELRWIRLGEDPLMTVWNQWLLSYSWACLGEDSLMAQLLSPMELSTVNDNQLNEESWDVFVGNVSKFHKLQTHRVKRITFLAFPVAN